jgi:hypothetical protein
LGVLGLGALLAPRRKRAEGSGRPRLYAFMPTFESTRAVQEILGRGLPDLAVTAFGRFSDFGAAVATDKPEGALALSETLRAVGIRPALHGQVSGSPQEPYVVLAKDQTASLEALSKQGVGVVDIVGRGALPRLVRQLLGTRDFPSVRRVLKVPDLLPVLQLDLAPAVLVPERFRSEFVRLSRLSLRVLQPPGAALDRAAIGFPLGGNQASIEMALRLAPPSVRDLLGAEVFR